MKTRADFARLLAEKQLSHLERAVALLWYYRHTQEYEERSASELAGDLRDEGFPKPNVTRLAADLRRSRDTARGKRPHFKLTCVARPHSTKLTFRCWAPGR